MLVILEGLDGTGKSTLAAQLFEWRGDPVVNMFDGEDKERLEGWGISVEDFEEDIYFLEVWKRVGFSAILDRSLPSAYVYNESVGEEVVEYWLEGLKSTGHRVVLVWMDASNETIIQRDPEWEGKEELLNVYRSRYAWFMKMVMGKGTEITFIDTTTLDPDQVFGEIKERIEDGLCKPS